MKILTADFAKISQQLMSDGIDELEVSSDSMVGKLVAGDTTTTVTVQLITKKDGSPGVKILKTIRTQTTVLDEEKV